MGYKALVLSSGAARGFYQLGALHAFDARHQLDDIKCFAGTSVGAIICLLLAVGWKPINLFSHTCTEDISQFFDFNSLDITRALDKWGMMDPNKLREYIKRMIITKWGGIPTFADLYKHNITFICTAYRMRHHAPKVYFSHHTHPNMSCLDAAMLSANIPLVFQSTRYDGDFYIDGGTFDQNPVRYVLDYMKLHDMLEPEDKILNISLDLRNFEGSRDIDGEIKNISEYVKEIIFLCMYAQDDLTTHSSKHLDLLKLHTDIKAAYNLQLDNKIKIKWFCSGLRQALNFLGSTAESIEEEHDALTEADTMLDQDTFG